MKVIWKSRNNQNGHDNLTHLKACLHLRPFGWSPKKWEDFIDKEHWYHTIGYTPNKIWILTQLNFNG